MKETSETELKLDAPPGFELPDPDGEPLARRASELELRNGRSPALEAPARRLRKAGRRRWP